MSFATKSSLSENFTDRKHSKRKAFFVNKVRLAKPKSNKILHILLLYLFLSLLQQFEQSIKMNRKRQFQFFIFIIAKIMQV